MRKVCPLFSQASDSSITYIHLAYLISSYILKLTYLAASARQPLFRPDRAPVPSAGGPGSCAPPLRTWTEGGRREVEGQESEEPRRTPFSEKGDAASPPTHPLSAPQNRADASARPARDGCPPARPQNDIGHECHMECTILQGPVR